MFIVTNVFGLSVCILSKITAVTLLQCFNSKNDKPINHLKYALAFQAHNTFNSILCASQFVDMKTNLED